LERGRSVSVFEVVENTLQFSVGYFGSRALPRRHQYYFIGILIGMRIFKSTTFTWWELGMLKWTGLSVGIAIGATWPDIFAHYAGALLIVAFVLAIRPTIAYFRQS
jgi:hypothetical protein